MVTHVVLGRISVRTLEVVGANPSQDTAQSNINQTNKAGASMRAEMLAGCPTILRARVRRTSLLAALCLVAVFLGVCNSTMLAQTGEWAWQSGSSVSPLYGKPGVYGTLGVAAGTNMPGGRYGAAMWFDKSGNLWLFGGYGRDSASNVGVLNDLWEFNLSTNEWTWMGGSDTYGATGVFGTQGTPSTSNIPPARFNPARWTDSSGNLWLFGGTQAPGNDAPEYFNAYDDLGDVWKFNPSTLAWTWMGGNSLICSGCGLVFTDFGLKSDGTFWLFGGSETKSNENGSGYLGQFNELSEYNPSTGAWNLLTGSITSRDAAGVYGTMGTPAAGNTPGAREGGTGWTDSHGNAWLFGGLGYDSNGTVSQLNDLWAFDFSSGEWTWMAGSNVISQTFPSSYAYSGYPGVYGTLGVPAAANAPGSRQSATSWTDSSGHLWLFGGFGFDSTGNVGNLNDLWELDLSTLEWTWVGGTNTVANESYPNEIDSGTPGIYFASGFSPANAPGGRNLSASAIDPNGNLWLFGGYGVDSKGTASNLSDLWEWKEGTPTPAPIFNLAAGTYTGVQSVAISDAAPGAKISYTTDGTAPTVNSTLYNSPVTIDETSETLQAIAVAPGDLPSAATSATYTLNLPAAATPVFTPGGGTYTTVQTVAITDSTPNATITYTLNGSVMTYTGPFTISSPEYNYLKATAIAPGYSTSTPANATYILALPPAATPVILPSPGTYQSGQTVTITDATPGVTITYTTSLNHNVTTYSGPITLTQNESVTATAIAYGFSGSAPATASYSVPLPTPVITPGTGTYTSLVTVTITDSFQLPYYPIQIHYTTDGSTPTATSSTYYGPVSVSSSETLKAIAIPSSSSVALPSAVASATYTLNLPPAPAPTFTPGPGTYSTTQNVILTDTLSGASIYYTTDGSTPTIGGSQYRGPISVSTSQTVQAIAIATGYSASPIASAAYTINAQQVAAPTFSVGSGVYSAPQTVTITSATPGASIYYAIGATPTTSSTLYTGPITVSSPEIVEAIAVAPGYRNSTEVSATYTINVTTASLSASGTDPYNFTCGILGPGTPGKPGPTGMVTFTDTSTDATLGTAMLGTSTLSTIYQQLNNTVDTSSNGMLSADFNGDGKLDLAVANGITVSILLGNGDGTFQPQVVYQVGVTPVGIVAADFNGDGKLDLAVANYWNNTLSILLGNGDGTFTGTAANPATGKGPSGIAVGDFNGDGKLDLAVTNYSDNTVSILLGNGDGTFEAQTTLAVGKGPDGIVAGLFSGSNHPLDLVVLNLTDHSLSVLVGNGDGTFQPESVISGEVGSYPNSIGSADFNGDGKPDLVVFAYNGQSGGQATVLLGNGDATFQYSSVLVKSIPEPFNASGLQIGHFLGSNHPLQIAVSNSGENNVLVFTSSGDGTLSGPGHYAPRQQGIGGVVAGDLNGDGVLDIATTDLVQSVNVLLSAHRADSEATLSNFTLNPDAIASHTFQCSYPGDTNYGPSTSNTITENFTQAALPQFSLLVNNYPAAQTVSITDSSPGAVIYYTTDGTNPTIGSTVYTGPITISSTTTLKAIAAGPYLASPIAEAVYTIANAPQFSAVTGTNSSSETVTITDNTPGAIIYYTTDGTTPSTSSSKYAAPIQLTKTTTINAFASAAGYINSPLSSQTYTLSSTTDAATPMFSVPAGTYTIAQTVAISDSTPGATIYYTTDGTTPTPSSAVFSNPIAVSSTETIKAIATASGYAPSAVATATYTINIPTPPVPVLTSMSPAFSSEGGAAFTLTITGSGFTSASAVYWGNTALPTQFSSSTQLTAQVSAADIAAAGITTISVQTPPPGGGTSNSLQYEVDSTSGSTTAPVFSTLTATVAPGSTATYPVTLPSSAADVSAKCLNLPSGAACSYSSASSTVTITTSATTPAGIYQITVVFTETEPGAASAVVLLPLLMTPFLLARRRLSATRPVRTAYLALILLGAMTFLSACGGGSSNSSSGSTPNPPPNPTHQVTSSGVVTLTIQ
jgi:hypothetical protein